MIDEPARRHLLLGRNCFARRQNRGDLAAADRDVAGGPSAPGKNGVAAFDHKIEGFHRIG